MEKDKRRPKPTDRLADRAAQSDLIAASRPSEVWRGVTYLQAFEERDGKRYGPYWRAYWHDAKAGRTRSKYIGREFRELREEDFA
jgi:hypothetical protein